jgi:hypothetical protein
MMFISGRVAKLMRNGDGHLNGLVLEDGWEVRFPEELGNQLACAISEGRAVAIEGVPRSDDFLEGYIYATRITNIATGPSASLPALKRKGKPGMQTRITPAETASLAPIRERQQSQESECSANEVHSPAVEASATGTADAAETTPEITNTNDEPASNHQEGRQSSDGPEDWRPMSRPISLRAAAGALHPRSYFQLLAGETDPSGEHAVRNDAARSIGRAYDTLHRLQAILAYLHIMKHRVPGISQFLDEAKHTYEQSLSRFAANEYTGAKEFAEASESLARVVEIVMGRTLRSDSTLPSLVPPPPKRLGSTPETGHVEEDLAHAESVLARIHWVLEHGMLPSEDRAQVRKIASWGDAFYKQAQYTYRNAVLEDASEFAQAALAGACSAEHVCRKWYVDHPGHH